MEGETTQPGTAVEDEPQLTDEERRVLIWRFAQTRRLGLSHVEARLFAESNADIGQFRGLIARGCSPDVALRIVL